MSVAKPILYDTSCICYKQTTRGVCLEFPLEAEEMVYGLGLQMKGFNHKGHKVVCRVNADPPAYTGDSHAPVPFFVTSKGIGVYVDTAREATFTCGYKKMDQLTTSFDKDERLPALSQQELYTNADAPGPSILTVEVPAPGVDIYIIEGKTITEVVAQYNMLAGGGCQVPDWGLGAIYRCGSRYTDNQILETAKSFVEKKLLFSMIGLEPGWHEESYPCSFTWNHQRFPDPEWLVRSLRELGYHVNLWEHAFIHPKAPFYNAIKPYCGDYAVWGGAVPDFANQTSRRIFADYHRSGLVELGVDGFKLDECDSSDYTGSWSFPYCSTFPSQMDGEQYHALFGTLYAQTILTALGEHETLSEIRSMGALAASYPFVLYSDLYNHEDFIRGTVTSGFSGLLWSPEVRDAVSREDFLRRLQLNVFSVHCIINAWYCPEAPWISFDCENEVRALLDVRQQLIPLLKAAFQKYHETGIPPVRALVMDYTCDRETYDIDDEYMFCENLLVAPMIAGQNSRKVYLPISEKWKDWWTGNYVESGWLDISNDNIPVFAIDNK